MKKTFISLMTLALILSLSLGALAESGYGASALSPGKDYTTEEMLRYALEDENLARAEYEAIIAKYGAIRPFTNIIKAEERHIASLLPLFNAYQLAVPQDDAASRVQIPASLEEAYSVGVAAEKANIAMYEAFLAKAGLSPDLKAVFEALKAASENHLKSFTRNLEKKAGQGGGRGQNVTQGQGLGQGQNVGQGQNGGRGQNAGQGQTNPACTNCATCPLNKKP